MLYATVRQRKIHVKNPVTVIRNGIKVDWLMLDMDDEWQEMTSIVCVFTNGDVAKEMLHTFGEPILVPWECLKETGLLSVSITGYVNDDKVMTTKEPDSFWEVVQNGAVTGEVPLEPTPTLYEQILTAAGAANAAAERATQISTQLEQDRANGVFDGRDGATVPLLGLYETEMQLRAAHPAGQAGEAYAVGTAETNAAYIWDTDRGDWVSVGSLKGKDGADGKDGTNGTNGTNGKDGANGKDGTDGAGVKSMTYNPAANNWTVTLTDNTTLTVDGPAIPDVSGYMPKGGGTFTGAVKAAAAATGGYYVRNIKFSETAETPATEGDICFKLA